MGGQVNQGCYVCDEACRSEEVCSCCKKPAAAKKPAAVKKPVAKPATKTAAKTATTTPTVASTTNSTSTARPTTRKRKVRTFDDDDEDDLTKEDDAQPTMDRPAKKPRASAKKAANPKSKADSEPVSEPKAEDLESNTTATPITRPTRGRPKKTTAATATTSAPREPTTSAATRTRTRRTTTKDDDTAVPAKKAPKKTARGRAATGTVTTTCTTEPTPGLKSAVSRPASKIVGVLKKTVTFQEPEKENMLPGATVKAQTETTGTTVTGMRAKPVRKPTASGRTTRASARAASTETTEKKPLSPKKDGQNLPLSRDIGSDDELATYEKTPLKPLMKSPVKPPSGVRKLELPPVEKEKEKDDESPQSPEPAPASVLNSPARRPPPSPFKDAMKSPAKRVDAVPSLIFSSASAETQGAQSPSKSTILQSPAKRLFMPLQAFQFNQEQNGAARSPMKNSLFGTPAKRLASPLKLLGSLIAHVEGRLQEAPKESTEPSMEEKDEANTLPEEKEVTHASMEEKDDANTLPEESDDIDAPIQDIGDVDTSIEETEDSPPSLEEKGSQIRAEIGDISPRESPSTEKGLSPIQEVDNEDSMEFEHLNSPTPQLAFSGRLSAVLPRHADPALKLNPLPVPELPAHAPQLNCPEPHKPESIVTRETPQNESSVELSPNEAVDVLDTVSEKLPSNVCVAGSEAQSSEQSKEAGMVEAHEQPLNACEDKSQERRMGQPVVEVEEQAPDVSEPRSDIREANLGGTIVSGPTQTTPPKITPKQLDDGGVSDSEDELALSNKAATKYKGDTSAGSAVPVTPAPLFKGTQRKISESAARAASRAIRSVSRNGFSVQLGAWRASSPLKPRQPQQKPGPQPEEEDDEFSLLDEDVFPIVETPAPKGFFDDEMKIRADMENQAAMEALLEADIAAKFDKHDFRDLGITDEDISFIAENHGTYPVTTQESDKPRPREESISEPSQEYGNENSVPIDPALVGNETNTQTGGHAPVTPKRSFASREFHTVSKVPLKRGDDSPPRSVKRICSTVTKAAIQRPAPFSNVTLPSQRSFHTKAEEQADEPKLHPVTPSKSAPWSSVGTPARAARPDLDSKLLSGATVFVDVHTTEGADAGRIFVDLLAQMGARCVKSWPWNPTSPTDGEVDVSKIGITHVVFKDGGKRTLEKVIESNGAVQCVGVSWVLDCEKENRWLDEKDYRVDTTLIPRGGHNRRKSMEPKAIANMNGTLVTPMKVNPNTSREPQTLPNNYMSRRDSTLWMRTPSENDEDEDAPSEPSEMDWESTNAPILTPVPQTPAPEMVAKFAMDISPGTPTISSFGLTPLPNQLFMNTCPPKQSVPVGIGEGLVNRDGNQSIQMRLLAARRKSMQWAPKVASPLKKQWEQMD
ncbi:hypothetical protein NUW58_g7845 [Xylaria curta]|uniref:Uncharacterized protein n=1 Tax=Xylaria curta TaxID=42375 RepID=A0ACC1NEK9_9PEZI|nr:hypothetical protein NUW58_g7845 [Xylaria curta]